MLWAPGVGCPSSLRFRLCSRVLRPFSHSAVLSCPLLDRESNLSDPRSEVARKAWPWPF